MQKVIDLPHVRVLVNIIPEGVTRVSFQFGMIGYKLSNKQRYWDTVSPPTGDWKYVNTYPGITEEQAAGIVEGFTMLLEYDIKVKGYENYLGGESFDNPIESLRSLLISNGLPVEGVRYAVLVEYK